MPRYTIDYDEKFEATLQELVTNTNASYEGGGHPKRGR